MRIVIWNATVSHSFPVERRLTPCSVLAALMVAASWPNPAYAAPCRVVIPDEEIRCPYHAIDPTRHNVVFVDLADDAWRAVEVTKTGWRVIDRPPVRFRRTAGMLPLPVPQEGGDVNALKDFLNIDDDGFLLAVAWQLAALGGIGPYPILCLYGEHGAAKTSGGRYCRRCIDPNVLLSRGPPRSAIR